VSVITNPRRSRRHRLARSIAKFFGYIIAPTSSVDEYGNVSWCNSENYAGYEPIQIAASRQKYGLSFARLNSCLEISDILQSMGVLFDAIICHGVRQGKELDFFTAQGFGRVLGTDLFVPDKVAGNIIKANFSVGRPEWIGQFDVVYSNAIDHAQNIIETIDVWGEQLKNDPRSTIVLEMDKGHGPAGSSDLDVSGINFSTFPFKVLLESKTELLVSKIERSQSYPDRYYFFLQKNLVSPRGA